jgi:hypothetical protein
VKDGIAAYDYNFLGMQRSTVAAGQKLTPGKHTIKFNFAYDGGGPGKGGLGHSRQLKTVVCKRNVEKKSPLLLKEGWPGRLII